MAIKWRKRKNTPLGGPGGLASHNAGCNSRVAINCGPKDPRTGDPRTRGHEDPKTRDLRTQVLRAVLHFSSYL